MRFEAVALDGDDNWIKSTRLPRRTAFISFLLRKLSLECYWLIKIAREMSRRKNSARSDKQSVTIGAKWPASVYLLAQNSNIRESEISNEMKVEETQYESRPWKSASERSPFSLLKPKDKKPLSLAIGGIEARWQQIWGLSLRHLLTSLYSDGSSSWKNKRAGGKKS